MDRIDKIRFLIEQNTKEIIAYIVEDKGIEYDEAFHEFYLSETFQKLDDPETGLYLEGSAYIYEIFKYEQKHGHISKI